jgi:hypothetical protein
MRVSAIYHQLADCEANERGALHFVTKYGLLRSQEREPLNDICNTIRVVRSLLKARDAGDLDRLSKWMDENRKALRLHPDFQHGALFFAPSSLFDAIFLQLFQDTASGAKIRLCARPACGEWFYYGPGTAHRSTAEYCTPKCQKAHTYDKSKGTKG